jgi:hypothetical protein
VRINDTTIFTDEIKLGPGETGTISHTMAPGNKGFKKVSIDSSGVIYKVYASSLESLMLDLTTDGAFKDHLMTDRSGFHNNGFIAGTAKDDKLLLGDNTYVEVPNAPVLDNLGETITMMGWIYSTGTEKGLIDMITKGDNHVLQLMDGKTLTFFAGGWGRGDCTVNLPSNWVNHWHHIAGVCTGNKLYLYIDGALAGTTNLDVTVDLSVGNKWVLGRNEEFPSERIFHGYINKVKIFKSPLMAAEIQAIFSAEQHSF